MKTLASLLVLSVLSIPSALAATPEPLVKVFKAKGSLQCEQNTGTAPQTMGKELEKAGISVKSTACGNDGMMHMAMCGAADGAINIYEIPSSKTAQAAKLGFKSLADLPDAKEIPCP